MLNPLTLTVVHAGGWTGAPDPERDRRSANLRQQIESLRANVRESASGDLTAQRLQITELERQLQHLQLGWKVRATDRRHHIESTHHHLFRTRDRAYAFLERVKAHLEDGGDLLLAHWDNIRTSTRDSYASRQRASLEREWDERVPLEDEGSDDALGSSRRTAPGVVTYVSSTEFGEWLGLSVGRKLRSGYRAAP